MPSFSSGIRHLYVAGLNEASYNLTYGINSWLYSGKNYYIDRNQGVNNFIIRTFDYGDFIHPYAHDINRLSCAAIQSVNDIQKDEVSPKFLGWILTRYYYSAFFSAHCILKIASHSLTSIHATSCAKVESIITSYGYTTGNQNKGQYVLNIDPATNTFSFIKHPQYDNSHEGLWRRFLDFWNNIAPTIIGQIPQPDAIGIIGKIDELKDALTNWGANGGNWLSRFRNDVNYSQLYGTWYPYKELTRDWNKIFAMQNLCSKTPIEINIRQYRGKDLLYFVAACQLINAINFNLLLDLKSLHPTNKSFVNNGLVQFHNKYLNKTEYNKGLLAI